VNCRNEFNQFGISKNQELPLCTSVGIESASVIDDLLPEIGIEGESHVLPMVFHPQRCAIVEERNLSRGERRSTMTFTLGQTTPEISLIDHTGTQLRLSSIWRTQPLVLFFVRHLG